MTAPTLSPPAVSPADRAQAVKDAWRGGTAPNVGGALRAHPELLRRSLVLDLAYEAYCLREEAGAPPDVDAFCRDLPAFRSDVRGLLRDYRQLVENSGVFDTKWPTPGAAFAGFEGLCPLAAGAYARAYLATDPDTGGRRVVLKLSPAASGEAVTLGPVRHPHVAEVLWARRVGDVWAICMPYGGAATLGDVVAAAFELATDPPTARTVLTAIDAAGVGLPPPNDPVPPPLIAPNRSYADAVARIAARLAGALAYLHARGVTHGDLKPSNVVLAPGGHPYLIDFNLSGGDADRHRYGGTLPYMAPERARRFLDRTAPAGAREPADVYAFGAVLHQALTGRVPFEPAEAPDLKGIAADLLARQRAGAPRLSSAGVPTALARLIDRCLAFNPAARPTAAELERGLMRFVRRRVRRAAWVVGTAAVVLTAAVGWAAIGPPAEPVPDAVPPAPTAPAAPTAGEWIDRGFASLRLGRPAIAITEFVEANALQDDGHTVALMGLAHTWPAGNHKNALSLYDRALTTSNYRPPWVRNNRAHCLIQLHPDDPRRLRDAVAEAEAALAVEDWLLEARYNQAHARFRARAAAPPHRVNDREFLAEVERELQRVIEADPDQPKVHLLMAQVLAAPDRPAPDRLDRAERHLETAAALGMSLQGAMNDRAFAPLTARPGVRDRLLSIPKARTANKADPGVAYPPGR